MHDACPCTKGVCLDTPAPLPTINQLNTTTGTTAKQNWQSGW